MVNKYLKKPWEGLKSLIRRIRPSRSNRNAQTHGGQHNHRIEPVDRVVTALPEVDGAPRNHVLGQKDRVISPADDRGDQLNATNRPADKALPQIPSGKKVLPPIPDTNTDPVLLRPVQSVREVSPASRSLEIGASRSIVGPGISNDNLKDDETSVGPDPGNGRVPEGQHTVVVARPEYRDTIDSIIALYDRPDSV